MLASLLPGLREVRTPLTVGYLWLLIAWSLWGDSFPGRSTEGLVGRLYRLSDFFKEAAAISAVSFSAYLVGAILTIPLEGVLGRYFLTLRTALKYVFVVGPRRLGAHLMDPLGDRLGRRVPAESIEERFPLESSHFQEYRQFLNRISRSYAGTNDYDSKVLSSEFIAAREAAPAALRPRLLVVEEGKEVYGEYDRAAAEASFRINVALPLAVMGFIVADHFSLRWIAAGTAVAAIRLFIQGLNRLQASTETIQRAAIMGIFPHPLELYLERQERRMIPVTPAENDETDRPLMSPQ